jgi:hypothetical protein
MAHALPGQAGGRTYDPPMADTPLPRLDANALVALARQADATRPCPQCGPLKSPGWESMPGSFDRKLLVPVGTLRDPALEDPTLQEYHPAGTHQWSADAPIAPAYFPCNRCDVWCCTACRRAYLRYTEYGGYYHDERVRELDAARVVDAPLA